jgi:hypothetical protein
MIDAESSKFGSSEQFLTKYTVFGVKMMHRVEIMRGNIGNIACRWQFDLS